LDQVVANQQPAGEGVRVVVGPASPPQILERLKRAVPVNDDVGEVDRPVLAAGLVQDGRRERVKHARPLRAEAYVRKPAKEGDVDGAVPQSTEAVPPDQLRRQ